MRYPLKFAIGALAVLAMVPRLSAQVPQRISHQGVVAVNGQRWTGNGKFRFAIIDVMGSYRWANDDNQLPVVAPQTDVIVPVVGGVYSVFLGAPPMLSIPFEAVSNGDAKLRVWFDDGVNGLQQLADDQLFASVPYAFNGVPAGTVIAYAGPSPPTGWLICDGTTVDRSKYAALFSAIGTAWGQGDGSSTFHLPELRGRFLRGVDDPDGPGGQPTAGIDPDSGSRGAASLGGNVNNQVGSVQGSATALPTSTPLVVSTEGSHSHNIRRNGPGGVQHTDRVESAGQSGSVHGDTPTDPAGAHAHTISGGDSETRPKNAYVIWIIKY